MFANMHLHHQNHHILFFIPKSCQFCTIDCESPDDGLTAPRTLPFMAASLKTITFITSFNGLVCMGINYYMNIYSDLLLWNPLTGHYKTLSKTNSHDECYETTGRAFVLYYLSSEDDYKLLRVTNSCNAYTYSLKSDMWTKIELPVRLPYDSLLQNHMALLDERVYFLKEAEADTFTYSIIKLDLKTWSYTEVAIPFSRGLKAMRLLFTVVRGCVNIWKCVFYGIELWRMDGDGDWTKVRTYRLVFGKWQPLHVMADGNWLMFLHHTSYLCKADPTKWHCKYKRLWNMDMDIHPRRKYLETLVSPNQYMK
ncbi:hypothetical protein L1987_03126 [Smallanthus sonchifolius]|uniref:Uncharacterized protein n=1 Tax=Smallanthus sonchifolius TaxID=185202 RepID=A0ACB9K9W2_9ASTR|nr:hypothetical protein L1987_03126 [Smallanthus sonchifolius]